MLRLLLVGLGGFIGSVGRYVIGSGVQRLFSTSDFPYGTLLVNVAGCALIGVIGALADARGMINNDARAFLIVGVLGGFTTFSAFAYETLVLMRAGATVKAGANVLLHVIVCMVAVAAGYALARGASAQ